MWKFAVVGVSHYHKDGNEFLSHFVTGDDAWIAYYTLENKHQSSECHHSSSPTQPRKFKQKNH